MVSFARRSLFAGLAAALLVVGLGAAMADDDRFIVVSSTTSTENSGLFAYLLPMFEAETGIQVRVVAVGTGKAIQQAKDGDADVLFVHHKPSEEAFVADGYGVERFDVMYNDFIVVGPAADPAGVAGMTDVVAAMAQIADVGAPFASRGDDSGTNKMELSLWQEAGIDPAGEAWYQATGSGMGATLNTASGLGAYTLTDRATWLGFANKGDLEIVVEGDDKLFNQYGIILVNPEKYPHVKAELGQTFIDWVLSPEGQDAIAAFEIDGQQVFFPNAAPTS
jgi:tungstate transport system substrate-binding protein